jgi:hypothetical protein
LDHVLSAGLGAGALLRAWFTADGHGKVQKLVYVTGDWRCLILSKRPEVNIRLRDGVDLSIYWHIPKLKYINGCT